MTGEADRGRILSHLRRDPLRHIVTLKMLGLFGRTMETRLIEDDAGWALLSLLPVRDSDFDHQMYPEAKFVVLVDGNSDGAKSALFGQLPSESLVVKTYDSYTRCYLENHGAKPVRSFLSFTSSAPISSAPVTIPVLSSPDADPEVNRLFAHNGYSPTEVTEHFKDGACWFGVKKEGKIVAAGMVFRNFEAIWEVGGLFTETAHRRQGFARAITATAIDYLLSHGRTPRYQVRSDNIESIRLARSAGLQEFLRLDHYLIDRR